MAESVALAALLLDVAFGWPPRLYAVVGHPVGGFARAIAWAERNWNLDDRSETTRRILGIVTMMLLIGIVSAAAVALQTLSHAFLGPYWWIGVAIAAWPGLALRSLYDHVRPVAVALASNDLPAGRAAVAMIVGRDTAALDDAGVARAAIESLAESICDGVVAPLFWLLLLGLPGIWAYKAINTADSLIGHREQRWRAFGCAAARIDDVANLVPARLSGALICLAAGRGWRIMWRDCRRHASPNAGWPEAAMAGALGVALAGPIAYDGETLDKPWIGSGGRGAAGADVRRALRIYVRACAALIVAAGGIAWLL